MADIFDFYVYDDRSIQFELAEPIMLEDKDVTQFRFRIPKSLNGFDMSTWAWWFVYVNPKKEKYSIPLILVNDEDDPDNFSVATFSINYGITEKEGGIQFALEVIDADEGGNVLHEWHTRTYSTSVTWTLQGNQTEYEEDITQDILSSIFDQIAVNRAQIALNKARIDNIAHLPDGSTTADAELIDIRVGADDTTYTNAGTAVRSQITALKNDLTDNADGVKSALGFDGMTMIESSSFISGARNASGHITNNSKCTTDKIYHLLPGHVISVSGYTSNIKYAIAGVNNGSYIMDSGWLTSNDERYISLEGDYFINVTTISGSGTLIPSDFDLTVQITPNFSSIKQMKEDVGEITGNKIYGVYDFRFCDYDASGDEVTYGNAMYARCIAICKFDKPQYIAIDHNDYTLGLCWKENGVLHKKATSPSWEVPANVTVAIIIRRSEVSSNPESMFGETPWKYLFTRTLEDKPRSFYTTEIKDTLEKIASVNTEPSLCFTLSTDQHYMTVINWLTNYDSISDMSANMRALGKSVKFDFNVSLGDIADFKAPYSTAVADRFGIKDTSPSNLDAIFTHWREYGMYKLKNINPNFIYVHGNHDDNRYLRVDSGASGYDYTPEEMYSYYMSNAFKTLSGSNPNNLLEYYFDVENLGIRIIILDSNYNNGSGWDYGFSDSTPAWLAGVLNSSSNKQVLILSHMSPVASHNGDNYAYHNFDAVANVIQEWKGNGGDLIALMYGHSHVDWSTTSPWLDITFCCQKIHQLPSSDLSSNMPGCVAPSRTFGTASEDCWNVVIIKPKSRKINVIRFGAGDDREFSY